MYDPKKIIDISNALIKGYSSRYDKYLDDRRTEWAERVDENFRRDPVGNDQLDDKAKERLSLLREIVTENEKYCRRDIEIPTIEFEDQFKKIRQFNDMRNSAGINEPFPGILAEEANLHMLKSDYSEAIDKLTEAISINERYPELIVKRDIVRYMVEQVRCLYMSGDFDASVDKATDTRRVASKIDPALEQKEWEKYCAAPSLQFIPIAIHAYFAACDARVHHDKWEENEKMQKEFSGLWSDSVTKLGVPKKWSTPMKIAAVSDRMWVARTESYVKEIAEQLYIELAPNTAQKVVRIVRAKWGGFNIDYPKSAAAAVALVAFLAASNVTKDYPHSEIKTTTVAYVMKHGGDNLSVYEVDDTVELNLPKDEYLNPEKVLQDQIDLGGFDVLKQENIGVVAYSSGSEGSVLRV